MDGLAITDLKSVTAPLNFLAPMAEKPVAYNYEPPPGTPVRTSQSVTYRVPIGDARPMISQLSLDKEGFVLLHHQTAVTDFYDEEQIKTVYYAECERMMQAATGAARVVAFDHIVRNAAMAAVKGRGVKMPAKRVHNDYTAWSSPKRVRELMGQEAEGVAKAPLRDHQSVVPDPRSVAGFAAGIVRRAKPRRGKPDRERPQIP